MCTFTSFCENWDANCSTTFAHEFINFVPSALFQCVWDASSQSESLLICGVS